MENIKTTNKAIKNAGGIGELARRLCEATGHLDQVEYRKMYQRIHKWQDNGVSANYIRLLSKIGKVPITHLIPDPYQVNGK
jgi:hypothetical protein